MCPCFRTQYCKHKGICLAEIRLQRIWKETVVTFISGGTQVYHHNQDSLCLARDANQEPLEYKYRVISGIRPEVGERTAIFWVQKSAFLLSAGCYRWLVSLS